MKFLATLLILFSVAAHADDVLFIGNSLTGVNNMPGLFLSLAKTHTQTPHVFEALKFGQTLGIHLADPAVRTLASSRKWDVVVLQEYSDLPLRAPQDFQDHILEFKKLVPGAHVFLFENWPYKDAKTDVIEQLNSAYDKVAKASGATVVHLGRAMEELRTHSALVLYSDEKHPTPLATYMNTLMMLDAIYGLKPEGMPLRGSNVNTSDSYVGAALEPALIDLKSDEAILVQKTAARFK